MNEKCESIEADLVRSRGSEKVADVGSECERPGGEPTELTEVWIDTNDEDEVFYSRHVTCAVINLEPYTLNSTVEAGSSQTNLLNVGTQVKEFDIGPLVRADVAAFLFLVGYYFFFFFKIIPYSMIKCCYYIIILE